MSTPSAAHLRPGLDPLDDPRDVAELAAALMSPRDRLLIFLVDQSLVGFLCVAVDLDHDDIAHLFTLIHEATLGTTVRGLVLAERTPRPLDLSAPIITAVIDAPPHGLHIESWVRFGESSVHDVWPDLSRRVGPDATP